MIERILDRLTLLFSTRESLRNRWPMAEQLTAEHIKNCKLITDRNEMLKEIPQNGVCAEIGIFKGDFSHEILQTLKPEKLHLVDVAPESCEIAKKRFRDFADSGVVLIHNRDSSSWLQSMPDDTFDWIYIDGDHSYGGVKKDLEAAHSKLKQDGMISLNDYIFFGSSDLTKYGVIEATNEFCLKYNYELVHFALHGRMYNDVTIRRMSTRHESETAF